MFLNDEQYKQIMKYSVIPTVDFIIINNNRVLLGLRNNKPLKGVYYFPGGRIEKGENLETARKRKFKEELGIDLDENNLKFLGIYDDFFDNSIYDGVTLQNLSITYVYNISDDEIRHIHGDGQHSLLKLFDINDDSLHSRVKLRINNIKIF